MEDKKTKRVRCINLPETKKSTTDGSKYKIATIQQIKRNFFISSTPKTKLKGDIKYANICVNY